MTTGVGNHVFTRQSGCTWHPVFTLPRNEKKVAAFLEESGIAAYLPLRRHLNMQHVAAKGRSYCYRRELFLPLFSNYLFACIPHARAGEVRRNRSVVAILPVDEAAEDKLVGELSLIRQIEDYAGSEAVDVSNGLASGVRVRFTAGRFIGWEGIVSDDPGHDGYVFINITSVESTARIHCPAFWCERVAAQ